MTPKKAIRDVPASVRQHLLNLAREQQLRFEAVLQRFAVERFLYRLSASDEVDRYTLKGAALLRMWTGHELRPTRDIDFLACGDRDEAAIRAGLRDICGVSCLQDGVVFDPATIAITSIRIDQPNGGLRVHIRGSLGRVRLTVPIDIGFGDVLTLGRREDDYPTLLDLPAPRLWTYPRETMVAEKFHAMASLGDANSRVKDLWDVACLARRFAFDGDTLRTAIEEAFRHRGTSLAGGRPTALLPAYYDEHESPARGQRWRELRRQIASDIDGPDRLEDAGDDLRRFLGPVCDSLIEKRPFTHAWPAGGPWLPTEQVRAVGEGGD
ncbi:MAG: nucleotidyl transferase AbiEii/AbiGii toxin family protein [Acidobacteria bacterium]|nr:nucleotidyl transferase AbiEii/AbiGii toxin family protein [Acidobacteriota bacterium]MYJ03458.1 nucleotidyl transferase AbiEii/AbiGii toxin family protein [Acidobacteriota bacterium]